MVFDWLSAMMQGSMRMCNSETGGASDSACSTESVDWEWCTARMFITFL